jgi:hypothetical protein
MREHLSLEALLQHAQKDAKEHYKCECETPSSLHPAVFHKPPDYVAGFYARSWYALGSNKPEEEEEEEYESYVHEFLKVYTELQEQDHLMYLERVKQMKSNHFNTLSRYERREELKEHFSTINAYTLGYLSPVRKKPLDHLKLQELELILQFLASTNPYQTAQDADNRPPLMDQMRIFLIDQNADKIPDLTDGMKIYFFINHLVNECEACMLAGYMARGNSQNTKRKYLTEAYKKLFDIQLLVSQCQKSLEEEA